MATSVQAERLVGTAELAHILALTRQRVFQLTSSDDFPHPVTVLQGGQIWDLADIRRWAARVGRDLLDLPTPWPPAAAGGGRSGKYRRSS